MKRERTQHLWQPTGETFTELYGTALPVTVIEELEPATNDAENGPMYCIVLPNGGVTIAFSDELDPEPVSQTLRLVTNQVGEDFWEEINTTVL